MSDATVLIIDDSAELRALLEGILPYGGYQTLSAGTGEQGLSLALHHKPDVILLDLELPDTSGIQVLEKLNEHGLAAPTIMITGFGSEGVAARALHLGALGYLIKPFTTEEVLTSVERALTVRDLRHGAKSTNVSSRPPPL
jgi:DNA-binding NtrC family response regulator